MYPVLMSEAFLISDLPPEEWLQIQIPPALECRKIPLWLMGKLLLALAFWARQSPLIGFSEGYSSVWWVMCTGPWGRRDAQLCFGTHALMMCVSLVIWFC